MTTETSLYVDTFITERPRNGINSPHSRLVSAIKLNDELAEYFRDRALIEDTYAKSIAKLTKKNYISNKTALGTFLPLWELLQVELSRAVSIHTEFSTDITENIEHPLRSCIQSSKEYQDIQKMEDHIQRIARDYDDLDIKIQKHKKSAKGEAKAADYMKQQEQKLAEWKQMAPDYFQKHQLVDEGRWNTIKSVAGIFESLQHTHASKIIEMTTNTVIAVEHMNVDDEIAAFCASAQHNQPLEHSMQQPVQQSSQQQAQHHTQQPVQPMPQDLLSLDNIVPEPSISDSSLKNATPSVKKEKKRFFQSLVSMRRKPKSDTAGHAPIEKNGSRQRSFSNAGSFVESLHSIHTHSTVDHQNNEMGMGKSNSSNNFIDITTTPSSPTSLEPPSLKKATSFTGSIASALTPQPAPLIVIDSEGFSIPPPDRSTWPLDAITAKSESLLEPDDVGSDSGSLFGSPRIRVDIKNEVLSEEDASQSAVALTRVATLLKEKNSVGAPAPRRLRGRREMRATQLYSVVEQDQMLPKIEGQSPAVSPAASPFANPFEMSQDKIIEEPEPNHFSEELPSIDVHITETVHVISKGGKAEKSVIWGEVSIQYKGPNESATPICFQINHPTKLDKVDATEFVSLLDGYEQDTFMMNTQLLSSGQSVVCVRYQVKLAADHLPLTVKPMWKCDTEKSRLLVKYHKHSDLPTLENVVFVTSITGNVQNALSIPAGELMLSQKRIKWNIGDIEDDSEAVIKAQFTTLEEATAQPIAVRFELKNYLMSKLNVDCGDDGLVIWARITSTSKSVKVGKYIAEV
ncbi:Muniscin C-terminal mu homology domain-containing protein [Thamnidium elegans]|nr:Muniscin C-terminal mu homology domain-containing protein [Thamnidium elegans]